jgi:phosphate:Na+ symporter
MIIVMLLAGIGALLTGVRLLNEGLSGAGERVRRASERLKNPLAGVGLGAGAAAAVNSSGAVTALTAGLINAGAVSFSQAAHIVLGANIGTTVSGLIAATESFPAVRWLSLLTLIGAGLAAAKKPSVRKAGAAITGAGLIFFGLTATADAARAAGDYGAAFFEAFRHPLALIAAGAALSAVFQSSAGVNGVIILTAVPYGAGGLTVIGGAYVLLGTNVGGCVTAAIVAAGGGQGAKKIAFFQFIFNVCGTVFFGLVLALAPERAAAKFFVRVFSGNPGFQLAWFNFFENALSVILFLPFVSLFGARPFGLTSARISDRMKKHRICV